LPLLFDLSRIVACDLSGVPDVAFVRIEVFSAACGEYAIGALFFGAIVRGYDPAQTGVRDVDSQRIDEILAPQIRGLHTGCRSPNGTCRQREDEDDEH